ncbi:MAG TPA: class I SAM-dependent methyltransferase [Bryobacteraceae bacterium]|nr:class I SAM-dependent methyltransferase [Bryobacteraceae bacterium]
MKTATEVQLTQSIVPMPEDIVRRYRENRNWSFYEKEWIYRNFPPAGQCWLDFGCGTGEITSQLCLLGASRVIAVDISPELVQMTKRRAKSDCVSERVRAECGDIRDLTPEPVNVALAFAVLHHVPDQLDSFVRAISRWVSSDGVFIFSEPFCATPAIERLRKHSGVSYDDLDEGERKLTPHDLGIIHKHFASMELIHFRLVNRLSRIFPRSEHFLRRIDAAMRPIPAFKFLAGTVLGVCRGPISS